MIAMIPIRSPTERSRASRRSEGRCPQSHRRWPCTSASCSSSARGTAVVSSSSLCTVNRKEKGNRCSLITSILYLWQASCSTEEVVKYTTLMFHRFISTAYDASVLFLHRSICALQKKHTNHRIHVIKNAKDQKVMILLLLLNANKKHYRTIVNHGNSLSTSVRGIRLQKCVFYPKRSAHVCYHSLSSHAKTYNRNQPCSPEQRDSCIPAEKQR